MICSHHSAKEFLDVAYNDLGGWFFERDPSIETLELIFLFSPFI